MNQIGNARELINIYLDDLYNSEESFQDELTDYLTIAKSVNLKREIDEYMQSASLKKEKLIDVYTSLNLKIRTSPCKISDSIMEETKDLAQLTQINQLRDVALLAGIQNINNYKIGRYRILLELGNQLKLSYPLYTLATLRSMEESTREILSWLANKQLFKDAVELVEFRE